MGIEQNLSNQNKQETQEIIEDTKKVPSIELPNTQEVEVRTIMKQLEKDKKNMEGAKETPEDFRKACCLLLEVLEKQEKTAKEGYIFTYGSETEKTSRGETILVDTLSWLDRNDAFDDIKKRLVLIATDPTNKKIIGLRLSDIQKGSLSKDEEEDNYINNENVRGEILTRYRGEGIATAVDTVFMRILTKVANEYKQNYPGSYQLNWNVENQNLKRIEEKNNLIKPITKTDIKNKEEQKRWQSLYGEGGKFGFSKLNDYDYTKTIQPDITDESLSKDQSIYSKKNFMKPVDLNKFQEIIESLKEFNN
jgi:hypothetical protein